MGKAARVRDFRGAERARAVELTKSAHSFFRSGWNEGRRYERRWWCGGLLIVAALCLVFLQWGCGDDVPRVPVEVCPPAVVPEPEPPGIVACPPMHDSGVMVWQVIRWCGNEVPPEHAECGPLPAVSLPCSFDVIECGDAKPGELPGCWRRQVVCHARCPEVVS